MRRVFLAWETLTPFSWLGLSSMSWGVSPGSWPARCFTSLCCVAPKWHYDGCAGFCVPGGQGMVAMSASYHCLALRLTPIPVSHPSCSSGEKGYKPIWEIRQSSLRRAVVQGTCPNTFGGSQIFKLSRTLVLPKSSHGDVFLSSQEKMDRVFIKHSFSSIRSVNL